MMKVILLRLVCGVNEFEVVCKVTNGTVTTTECDYPYKYYPTARRWFHATREMNNITIYKEKEKEEA